MAYAAKQNVGLAEGSSVVQSLRCLSRRQSPSCIPRATSSQLGTANPPLSRQASQKVCRSLSILTAKSVPSVLPQSSHVCMGMSLPHTRVHVASPNDNEAFDEWFHATRIMPEEAGRTRDPLALLQSTRGRQVADGSGSSRRELAN